MDDNALDVKSTKIKHSSPFAFDDLWRETNFRILKPVLLSTSRRLSSYFRSW